MTTVIITILASRHERCGAQSPLKNFDTRIQRKIIERCKIEIYKLKMINRVNKVCRILMAKTRHIGHVMNTQVTSIKCINKMYDSDDKILQNTQYGDILKVVVKSLRTEIGYAILPPEIPLGANLEQYNLIRKPVMSLEEDRKVRKNTREIEFMVYEMIRQS